MSLDPMTALLAGTTHGLEARPAFLEMLPIAIYACDATGRILWFNSAAVALWGRTPRAGKDGELFSGSHKVFLDDRPISREETPTAEAIRTGRPVQDVEVKIERPDGSSVWVTVHIQPVRDDKGQLVGVINCFHDTTELHRTTAHLHHQQQDLEDFFDNAAVALHLVARDGTIIRANRAELELLGYEARDYIGRKINDFHADGEVIEDILARLGRGEMLDKYPARLVAKDGSIKRVLITSNVQFKDGQFVNTRCFTLDVTDSWQAQEQLAESHERFLQLLEALPAAVYTTDAAGRITYYNNAAVELSGRRPKLGSDEWCVSWRLYHPDGTPLPHDQCPMAVALKENRPVRGAEAIAERPDGTRVPFIPYPTPLRDASGKLIGAVNMLVDISERKQSETQMRVLLDELNHRVKNNLQMLHSMLSAAQRETSDGEAKEVLNDACARVSAMASAQQALYRPDGLVEFNAKDLVEAVCESARRSMTNGVNIIYEAGPQRVSNDAAMPLALILNELITNAVKHGTNGHKNPTIWVGLGSSEECLELYVEDEGPGFDLQEAQRRSSGLGLVMGLARQLGGRFKVQRGRVTRCSVRFPP
jgi:PAS domain S-box-containing protein